MNLITAHLTLTNKSKEINYIIGSIKRIWIKVNQFHKTHLKKTWKFLLLGHKMFIFWFLSLREKAKELWEWLHSLEEIKYDHCEALKRQRYEVSEEAKSMLWPSETEICSLKFSVVQWYRTGHIFWRKEWLLK